MRVAVIILSGFAGLALFDHTVIPMRLIALVSSSERTPEGIGSLLLFAGWAVATALVYGSPGLASWLFAMLGFAGLFLGGTLAIEEFVFWGALAVVLAALTSGAGREKRRADQREWARTQHELAVHAALRSLHESVPELLTRTPVVDGRDPYLHGLVEVRPDSPAIREVARR